MTAKRILEFAGYGSAALLVAFGIAALIMGMQGRNEVRTDVKREFVVGESDMNRTAILAEAKQAGMPANVIVELPTCDVANKPINSGSRAKCFAAYMRVHTLEATGGLTYAQMGRFLTPDGKGTNDASKAKLDPKTGQPVQNGARNLWVTELAISTALNTSFFAEQVANFSMVIGISLILIGVGLGVLALVAFRWLPARGRSVATGALLPGETTPQAT
jgi:hypothetical protein